MHSKPIIDEINKILARHYGFTDEELDFIPSASLRTGINYDIKYSIHKRGRFYKFEKAERDS